MKLSKTRLTSALFLGAVTLVVVLLSAAGAGAEETSAVATAGTAVPAAAAAPEPLIPAVKPAPKPAICGDDESPLFLAPASCNKPCNIITCPPPFWCEGPCWPDHCMA